MKDVLVKEDMETIKSKLRGKVKGGFCSYRDLNGTLKKSEEGRKILFSDGERIQAESVIINIREGDLRFEPLTPVNRPQPETPPEHGVKYVDASQCGRYHIKFMGIEHSYKTFHDLTKAILKNREETRHSLDALKHAVWTEAQDLDLNNREEFLERIEEGTIRSTRNEFQVKHCVYPPTDPEELERRYSQSNSARRLYNGLQGYVESAVKFYQRHDEERVANQLDEYFSFKDEQTSIDVRKVVKRKVANTDGAE